MQPRYENESGIIRSYHARYLGIYGVTTSETMAFRKANTVSESNRTVYGVFLHKFQTRACMPDGRARPLILTPLERRVCGQQTDVFGIELGAANVGSPVRCGKKATLTATASSSGGGKPSPQPPRVLSFASCLAFLVASCNDKPTNAGR